MKLLFFDTETTGITSNYKAPLTDSENWPRLVQLAFALHEFELPGINERRQLGKVIHSNCSVVRPDGFEIPEEATKIHGIKTSMAKIVGIDLTAILAEFTAMVNMADFIIGHNISYDRNIVGAEFHRMGMPDVLHGAPRICTMMKGTQFCQIWNAKGTSFKWPKLEELHSKLFPGTEALENLHNAGNDMAVTIACFREMWERRIIREEDLERELTRVLNLKNQSESF